MIKIPRALKSVGPILGAPLPRVDGRAKVTGQARYAAEHPAEGLLHGCVLSSAVAHGRIAKIDADVALALPGVLQVFTHQNRPNLAWFNRKWQDQDAPKGEHFRPLGDDRVRWSGQPVALVVAESAEQARFAASLVRIHYERLPHQTDLEQVLLRGFDPGKTNGGFQPPPSPRGDADHALATSRFHVSGEYFSATEHHNPMEPFATTVAFQPDGRLLIFDKTQSPLNSHDYVCSAFGLSADQVEVRVPFVGGAFGSGLRPQYQLVMATMAALQLKRSVRVELTRAQMFTFGHRPATWQRVQLGCDDQGRLRAVIHDCVAETSQFEDYGEQVVNWSGKLYACDNVKLSHQISRLDIFTPLDMRAPGAVNGLKALECSMDELAYQVGLDPLELRLRNYTERDPSVDKPYSSKELRACYQQGAARFGWERRSMEPGSMRDGHVLVGWGMASGQWDAQQQPASARAVLSLDGSLQVSSATCDIGTGTYTVMSQIAAEISGVPMAQVSFRLGDSRLPQAPLQGGSWTVSSVGSAVQGACQGLCSQLLRLGKAMPGSPFADLSSDQVSFADGRMFPTGQPERGWSFVEIMRSAGKTFLEEQADVVPNKLKQAGYSLSTHSAVFAEVRVDEHLRTIEVSRVVSAVAAGRILNPLTARNQVVGAVVWGISMALHEDTLTDHALGRIINHNLAEYHVPVHKDVRDVEVIFVEEHDDVVNPLGVKGVGEIGIVGTAAAVANAVFHATGRRLRRFPMHLEDLLD